MDKCVTRVVDRAFVLQWKERSCGECVALITCRGSVVNIATVPNADDSDDEFAVLDGVNNTVGSLSKAVSFVIGEFDGSDRPRVFFESDNFDQNTLAILI